MLESLVGLIIFVADIWAILQIAKSSASTGSKAIWIAIVLLLPVVGLIAWWLLGPK
jgi:hypothetical protein